MRQTPTDNPPRTGSLHSGRYRSEFDSTLPPDALDEMLQRSTRRRRSPAPAKLSSSWLRGLLIFAGIVCLPFAAIAIAVPMKSKRSTMILSAGKEASEGKYPR